MSPTENMNSTLLNTYALVLMLILTKNSKIFNNFQSMHPVVCLNVLSNRAVSTTVTSYRCVDCPV
jgi:hypothetical protein